MRLGLLCASAAVLLGAAVLAATDHPETRFTRDDVVLAFAEQGFALDEPTLEDLGQASASDDDLGVTTPEVTRSSEGSFLLVRPFETAQFYVVVASDTRLARRHFEELVRLGQTPGTFDLLRGNVLVSSDSSFTENGLSRETKARIRAAMDALPKRS